VNLLPIKLSKKLTIKLIIISATLSYSISFSIENKVPTKKALVTLTPSIFKAEMRKMWMSDAFWSRNFTLCLIDDLPGIEQTKERLVEDKKQLGNCFKNYYSEQIGNEITDLLQQHLTISEEVIRTINSNNTDAANESLKKWYINANEIAIALNKLNYKWSTQSMKQLWYEQIKLTLVQINLRYQKAYESEIIAAEHLLLHYYKIADTLSDELVKQFPEKFKPISTTLTSKNVH
jgi:hypothetical protein